MGWIHLQNFAHDQGTKYHYRNYVYAANGSGGLLYRNSSVPLEWESFALWAPNPPRAGDSIALMTQTNNQFVCAENGGGAHLVANRGGIGAWETFKIWWADGRPPTDRTHPMVSGSRVYFTSATGHLVTCPTANGEIRADYFGGVRETERFTLRALGNQPRIAYNRWANEVQATV